MFLHVSWLKLMNKTSFSLTRLSWPLGSTKWFSNPSWLGVEWRFHSRDFQEHPNMIRWLVVPFCLHLVGGFNPSEKYESELGWLSHILWKIKNVPNHQPAIISPIHPHILSGWRFRHVLTHPKKTLVISTTHPKCIWNNISTVEPPARHVLILILPFWDDPSKFHVSHPQMFIRILVGPRLRNRHR